MTKIENLLILLFALFISGCVTTPEKPSLPETLADKHGVAIVRVVTNASTVDRGSAIYLNQWLGLKLLNQEDKIVELKPLKLGGLSGSQILAAELPAGKYRLLNVYTRLAGETGVSLSGANESFEVQAATLTALGTIIVQPTGNHQFTTLRDLDNSGLIRMLNHAAPRLAESVRSKNVLTSSLGPVDGTSNFGRGGVIVTSNSATTAVVGTLTMGIINALIDQASATEASAAWRTERDPVKRLAMAKDSTYALNTPTVLDSGELMAGSNLGQILIRTSTGTWGRLDVGSLREITALAVVSRQNIVVGGEEGYFAESIDGGRSWKPLPMLPSTAVTTNLQRIGKATLALVLDGEDAVVYQLDTPESTAWSELKREKKVQGTATLSVQSPQSLTGAAREGNRYLFTNVGGPVHTLDLQTRLWTTGKAPFIGAIVYRPMSLLRSNQEGVLFSPHSRQLMVSQDFGASWHEQSHACGRIMDTVLTSDRTLYSLCTEGAFVVGTAVYIKRPGQAGWQNQGTTPIAASGWYVSPDGKLIVLVGPEGQLYASNDSGKSWRQEYRQ